MDKPDRYAVSSLYETSASGGALKLAGGLERHIAPKDGSWLDMGEIGLRGMVVSW